MMRLVVRVMAGLAFALAAFAPALAQEEIRITQGELRARPISVPDFIGPDEASRALGADIAGVIINDLESSGWFDASDPASHIQQISDIDVQPRFADWRLIGSEALVAGSVEVLSSGDVRVAFRLWNVQTQSQMAGLRFETTRDNWRRVAHQVADRVYERLLGDEGYFDTRIVYIHESGPKTNPVTRLAIMDQDGANPEFLTNGDYMVLLPTFSPTAQQIAYVSFRDMRPTTYLFDIETGREERLFEISPEAESYSARFSPDGQSIVTTVSQGGNSDIHVFNLSTRRLTRITNEPSLEAEPSFDPTGRRIVFRSNRAGESSSHLYTMNVDGTDVRRLTFGQGIYGTPVWSPRGDYIAFTNQSRGQFRLGVIRPDGTGERIITQNFKIDRPTWSPNGRVLMFSVEYPGSQIRKEIRTIDVTGRNERVLNTPGNASDPAWSPLLR